MILDNSAFYNSMNVTQFATHMKMKHNNGLIDFARTISSEIVKEVKAQSILYSDFVTNSLITSYSLGTFMATYQRQGEMDSADVTLHPESIKTNDKLNYDNVSDILFCVGKIYKLLMREQASGKDYKFDYEGNLRQLTLDGVIRKIDEIIFKGTDAITNNGSAITGVYNTPYKTTIQLTDWGNATNRDLDLDIKKIQDVFVSEKIYASTRYICYMSRGLYNMLHYEYKASSHRSIKEKLMESDIFDKIQPLDLLTGKEFLMMPINKNYVDYAQSLAPSLRYIPQTNGLSGITGLILAIGTPRIKTTMSGQKTIIHGQVL